ncbi:hypothetical protein [Paraburkholderia sp.]|uniref:hypothetical protein n=1 Tax=Paraburkholderia sp. TaxID=1926495 RepID=UPI002AFF9E6E|nr:hypothetical protein [Paraburkholderia sp.]
MREIKIDGLLPEGTTLRLSKDLNNLLEQEHRNLKAQVNVMLSFNASGPRQQPLPASS